MGPVLEGLSRVGLLVEATPFEGLLIGRTVFHRDDRGAFGRLYCRTTLAAAGVAEPIRQINSSLSAVRGTVRGLHFQYPPHTEIKIVRCLRGRVFDVAVDVRKNSPTFLKWHAIELAPELANCLVIPHGFAHGFQTLSNDAELLYLHTADYQASAEGGLRFDDPAIGIDWPLPPANLSARDLSHPPIAGTFEGINL